MSTGTLAAISPRSAWPATVVRAVATPGVAGGNSGSGTASDGADGSGGLGGILAASPARTGKPTTKRVGRVGG
ncbi:hypothetical protein BZL30_4162 [Mycobacterium kansasii]|uniref:Uncharacterized protein n=1 Tax=Mycobacterium kansasii TaxID=1768 RepID=A0A1V3XBA5_MYCKA|nr:hypothetical protein BZL30_4162 [Mycobacterium kansasii]